MKKYLLMACLLAISICVSAQTFENPSHDSNDPHVRVTKVVRNRNHTVIHVTVKYNYLAMRIMKAPILIDQNNKKKYYSRNFKEGGTYTIEANKSLTFKVEFPPIPRSCSRVTFKNDFEGWVIKNIKIPVKQKSSSSSGNKTVIINM